MAKLKKCVIDAQEIMQRFNQNYEQLRQERINAYPKEALGPDFGKWTQNDIERETEKFGEFISAPDGMGGLLNSIDRN